MINQIKLALGLDDEDTLTQDKKGYYTLRREYYWRPKNEPEAFFLKTIEKLNANNIEVVNATYGDKLQSFKGNQGVKGNSHYWMKFKAKVKST